MLNRKGSIRSINRAFPCLAIGCIAVLAVVAIITSELSVATASSVSSAVSSANIVDRSQKGDRLQLAPTFFRTTASLPLAHSKSADVAKRCLS